MLNNQIHILVVGDQTVARKGLSSLLNNIPTLLVVGEAASGQEAALMARESRPDIVLIEYKFLDKEGSYPLQHIWQENSNISILVLGNSVDHTPATNEFDGDRFCFIDKDAATEELTQVIQEMVNY